MVPSRLVIEVLVTPISVFRLGRVRTRATRLVEDTVRITVITSRRSLVIELKGCRG